MKRTTLLVCLSLLLASAGKVQANPAATADTIVTFKFVPGQDMFYIPWGGNDKQLQQLGELVERYRTQIASGKIPLYVNGYCTSLNDAQDNLKTAAVRSNRVKSELITHKGLTEGNFVTRNHATAYTDPDGKTYRDMVVVTLRIPAKPEPQQPEPQVKIREASQQPVVEEAPVVKEKSQPVVKEEFQPVVIEEPQPVVETLPEPAVPMKPYCFAVRTNLLYDAFLTPTLGVEWRINPAWSVKLDGSRSWGGDEKGKVQKVWLVSPEVRWYLLDAKRFYLGLGGNFGEYNIYKGMVGDLFSDDTGYQGKLYGGGLTVGYQLYLSRSFSLDFNLGLGYTRFEYDSFSVSNEVRVFKDRDKTKNFWGPTQAGISLVWTIGGNK